MTRKPTFWIFLALLGLVGSVLAHRLFPVAFPILSVDIRMDRQEALEQARALADAHQWEPEGFRQAASFAPLSPVFQTYMELEGGGLGELNRLVREGAFDLYAWRVRHFVPGTVEEVEIRFTPSGEPSGFHLRLSEETPGERLDSEQARELALEEASRIWRFDPGRFTYLEASEEERPGGRLDHTFVYERSDLSLGEAKVRLRLGVAGDRLVEVSPFLHVPEGFLRRYQDTRNANESISLAGTVAFLLIFLILGGGIGAVHLLRKRRMEWKTPLLLGGLVGGLMALGTFNSLPLTWMGYDTALPVQVHVATTVSLAVITFLFGTLFLALVFSVGEGLMRLGFPDHIQQWKIWAPGVANSTPTLGRTLGPYLVLGLELGFVVVFYLVTSRLAGWWSPAGSLAEPDLLATYQPWLTAVSTSLFAALSEESIFRAIPIGAAAFLGRRHGRPGLWIWSAIVLQAVVFGASHANYPQQPAYARIVEIFPVYIGWGIVCAHFGLIPAIIGHYTYDLVLFSLPLFSADTSGIWLDRSVVVLAGLFPLLIVLFSRWRRGGVSGVPPWALNRNWKPGKTERTDTTGSSPDPGDAPPAGFPRPGRATAVLALAGLAGLLFWVTTIDRSGARPLDLSLAEAEDSARAVLATAGTELGPEWMPLLTITGSPGMARRFSWETGSPAAFEEMKGRFLHDPAWEVRFVSFEVPPEERAERFLVSLPAGGEGPRASHVLPEGRPGEGLTEEEARTLALEALRVREGIEQNEVREISAVETSRPARTDWVFVFQHTRGYPLPQGEGRTEVQISGDEITELRSFVHVPEEWERDLRSKQSWRPLTLIPMVVLLALAALGGLIFAVVRWSRGGLAVPPLRVLFMVMALLLLVSSVNEWPSTMSGFTTQMSLGNQMGAALLALVFGLAMMAMGVGLFGAMGHTWVGSHRSTVPRPTLVGLAAGSAYVGFIGLLSSFGSDGPPPTPSFSGAVSYFPWLAIGLSALTGFLMTTAGGLFTLAALERLRRTRWNWVRFAIFLLIGLTAAISAQEIHWLVWIGKGAGIAGGIWGLSILCRRLGWAILPGAIAAPVLLGALKEGIQMPHPGSSLGTVLGLLGVLVAVHLWTGALNGSLEVHSSPSRGMDGPGTFPETIIENPN